MSKENKQIDSNSPESQEENKQDDTQSPESQELDYKSMLEEEKAKREKLEQDLEHSRFANEKKKKQLEDLKNEEPQPLDSDDIVNKLDARAKEREEKRDMESRKDFIDETINKLSDDPNKQKLIKLKYENSIKKTGFSKSAILDDLSSAIILVDKPKILQENKELKNTLTQRSSATSSGMGTNQAKPNTNDYKATDEDRRIAEKYFNGNIDRYLKTKNK